jgi:hypothetical protein
MSLRDKQKAKKKHEEEHERKFYELTGIKDESKDFSLDNLIKKFEYDMNKYEKKIAKMRSLDK